MTEIKINRGKILLAEPFMVDSNFKRTVVLMCEHEVDGSLGFILNRSLDMKISDLISDFPEINSTVYYGGPVQTDTIHYIHNAGELLDESQEIANGIYWGGNFEQLKALIREGLINEGDIQFFIGYSGWSSLQLNEEMTMGSWVVADLESNYLFKRKEEDLWQQVMVNKGDIYTIIAQMPDAINWN